MLGWRRCRFPSASRPVTISGWSGRSAQRQGHRCRALPLPRRLHASRVCQYSQGAAPLRLAWRHHRPRVAGADRAGSPGVSREDRGAKAPTARRPQRAPPEARNDVRVPRLRSPAPLSPGGASRPQDQPVRSLLCGGGRRLEQGDRPDDTVLFYQRGKITLYDTAVGAFVEKLGPALRGRRGRALRPSARSLGRSATRLHQLRQRGRPPGQASLGGAGPRRVRGMAR